MSTLLLDIETFPHTVTCWGTYKQNILEVKEHSIVCCYSAKWLGGDKVTRSLADLPKYNPSKRDDSQLVKELWKLVNEAEIVVAHYGDGFDLPVLRASFMRHNLLPPSPFKTIDTKKVAAKLFHFGGAYSLNHICQYLGIGEKMATGGYDLWKGCMAGDMDSWRNMKLYNSHDVSLLENLYLYMRPWIANHPNIYPDKHCPKCGSQKLQSRGSSRSNTRTYKRFQCTDCGGWGRYTKSDSSISVVNA